MPLEESCNVAAFVLDHSIVPPGGCFYYVQPETKARIEGYTYESWMESIRKHREGNGIELEPLWKLHVEEWMCHDFKARGIDWCRIKGAGDVLAYGLRPLAHAADQYLGTNLATCKGCSNTKHRMNNW